jgi:hypothetical protein
MPGGSPAAPLPVAPLARGPVPGGSLAPLLRRVPLRVRAPAAACPDGPRAPRPRARVPPARARDCVARCLIFSLIHFLF